MGELSYEPIIRGMTWSFSRIKAFEQCPHCWFLSYIKQYKQDDRFYTSYGSFIHSLLEKYYNGALSKTELLVRFAVDFPQNVKGDRPQAKTVEKYVNAGYKYLAGFRPVDGTVLAVEKKIDFDIDGAPFVGVIDLVTENDGELAVIDHKSRELKPRSDRAIPTATDKELDVMLKQLYLYAGAIKHEFGRFPDELCFNCFRNGEFIREKFDEKKYEEAKKWALDMIETIAKEEEFEPKQNYFFCRWLCPVSGHCDAFLAEIEGGR